MTNQDVVERAIIGIEWEPQFTLPYYSGYQVLFENDFVISSNKPDFLTIREELGGNSSKQDPFYCPKKVIIRINNEQFKKFINKISKEISRMLCLDDKKQTKKFFTEKLTELTGIDGTNMEFRTIASSFKQLPNSIAIADSLLFLFIEKINKYIPGGVGVFLPKTTGFEVPEYIGLNGIPQRPTQLHFIPTKHVNITFSDMPMQDKYWRYGDLVKAQFFKTRISLKSRKLGYPRRLHITVPYNFTDYGDLIKVSFPMYQKIYDGCQFGPGLDPNVDVTDQYNIIIKYLDDWAKNNPMNSPILLKYIKKSKLVNLRSLI